MKLMLHSEIYFFLFFSSIERIQILCATTGNNLTWRRWNSDIDPLYECDAPTYMDFNELGQGGKPDDDDADAWFGEKLSPYLVQAFQPPTTFMREMTLWFVVSFFPLRTKYIICHPTTK